MLQDLPPFLPLYRPLLGSSSTSEALTQPTAPCGVLTIYHSPPPSPTAWACGSTCSPCCSLLTTAECSCWDACSVTSLLLTESRAGKESGGTVPLGSRSASTVNCFEAR